MSYMILAEKFNNVVIHIYGTYFSIGSMSGSRKFCQRGSNFDDVFFF